MKYICDTIKSFSQHYVTKFGRDLRRSVVFSWYPEHLGLPPDFGFAHHFSVCVVFHIFFVFVPYVASFSGLSISLTFMQYINYQL